jgi:hypothetical protein
MRVLPTLPGSLALVGPLGYAVPAACACFICFLSPYA